MKKKLTFKLSGAIPLMLVVGIMKNVLWNAQCVICKNLGEGKSVHIQKFFNVDRGTFNIENYSKGVSNLQIETENKI